MTADKREERMEDTVEKVTGHPPQNLDSFIEENKLGAVNVLYYHRRQKAGNSEISNCSDI
jgi:hypothetical protein